MIEWSVDTGFALSWWNSWKMNTQMKTQWLNVNGWGIIQKLKHAAAESSTIHTLKGSLAENMLWVNTRWENVWKG